MLISIVVFVIVIVTHEFAHAYTAYLFGDRTAKDAGRLTLNPLRHADPFGTVIFPAILIFMHSPVVFGWARPVPINPRNFKNPRQGLFFSSLAGPAANFVLAVIFAFIFKMNLFAPHSVLWTFLLTGIIISLVLCIFNLIPIPPLDGANIIMSVLPFGLMRAYGKLEKYGFFILIIFLYLGLFDKFIIPIVNGLTRILIR